MGFAAFHAPQKIQKAVEMIIESTPVYAELLRFYGPVFIAQEESRLRIRMDCSPISEKSLRENRKNRSPLIAISEFHLDMVEAKNLLRTVCRCAENGTSELKKAADGILHAIDSGNADSNRLFSMLLQEHSGFFDEICRNLSIDKEPLMTILFASIKPSLSLYAEHLASYLPDSPEWQEGICPVCGSIPFLSCLGKDGERILCCSFCGYEWKIHRIYCPFCGNTDSATLSYFYSDLEAAYRVDVCERCRTYVKNVDIRKLGHYFYPPLEQIVTLHLDIAADQRGYKGAGQSLLH